MFTWVLYRAESTFYTVLVMFMYHPVIRESSVCWSEMRVSRVVKLLIRYNSVSVLLFDFNGYVCTGCGWREVWLKWVCRLSNGTKSIEEGLLCRWPPCPFHSPWKPDLPVLNAESLKCTALLKLQKTTLDKIVKYADFKLRAIVVVSVVKNWLQSRYCCCFLLEP